MNQICNILISAESLSSFNRSELQSRKRYSATATEKNANKLLIYNYIFMTSCIYRKGLIKNGYALKSLKIYLKHNVFPFSAALIITSSFAHQLL